MALASNPSHLEAVGPVVEGMARAIQDALAQSGAPDGAPAVPTGLVLPVLVHGDAAFAGQGVVAETLNMSTLAAYETGGTVHLVINNQLGFTTNPESARSSVYATDVAKMVQAPIFHVNGDDPEACVRVARTALAFRQEFHKDVVIDMVCYRRYGHNEQDDPSLTQPLLYQLIKEHRSVRKLYTEALVRRGDITLEEAEAALADFARRLQTASGPDPGVGAPPPDPVAPGSCLRPPWPWRPSTAAPAEQLADGRGRPHPSARGLHAAPQDRPGPRSPGQAVGLWPGRLGPRRGACLRDRRPGRPRRAPGAARTPGAAPSATATRPTSTTARGRSTCPSPKWQTARAGPRAVSSSTTRCCRSTPPSGSSTGTPCSPPGALVAWEAQFGDFVNGAQVVIDQFLAASEVKWEQRSRLVLLLPHGYEGQGPSTPRLA